MAERFVTITDPEEAARLGVAGLLWVQVEDINIPCRSDMEFWGMEKTDLNRILRGVTSLCILLED